MCLCCGVFEAAAIGAAAAIIAKKCSCKDKKSCSNKETKTPVIEHKKNSQPLTKGAKKHE